MNPPTLYKQEASGTILYYSLFVNTNGVNSSLTVVKGVLNSPERLVSNVETFGGPGHLDKATSTANKLFDKKQKAGFKTLDELGVTATLTGVGSFPSGTPATGYLVDNVLHLDLESAINSAQSQSQPTLFDFAVSPQIRRHFEGSTKALEVVVEVLSNNPTLTIEGLLTGEGDSGDYNVFDVYDKDGRRVEVLTDEQVNTLADWMWRTAEHAVPGYEINDGGGYKVRFTIENKTLKFFRKGWYNEINEAVQIEEVI